MEETPSISDVKLEVETLSLIASTKKFMGLAFPIFIQQFLRFVSDLLNFVIVAYIDNPTMLGGLGLAMAFYVTSTMAVFIGLNSGIATFAAQLLGMGKVSDIGTYLNSGRIINFMLCIPLMTILGLSEHILLLLNQDSEVAYYASQFLKGLIPGLPFIAVAFLHSFYLNSLHIQAPALIAIFMGFVVQIICSMLFVFVFNMGLFGCGLAASFSSIAQSLILIAALFYYDESREAQYKPSMTKHQWLNMKEFINIGVPSLLITALEIGGIEIMQPLSGLISADDSGAQSIVMSVFSAAFTIQISISITTSIFVGQSIGNGKIYEGRLFTKASLLISSVISVLAILVIASLKTSIVSLYTSDEDIQDKAIEALTFYSVALLPDSIIFSLVGAFRGLGQQKAAALIAIASFAFISIPLGCVFAYTLGMEIAGFWLGYAIRCIVASFVFWGMLWYKLDWQEIANDSFDREEKQRLQRTLDLSESGISIMHDTKNGISRDLLLLNNNLTVDNNYGALLGDE